MAPNNNDAAVRRRGHLPFSSVYPVRRLTPVSWPLERYARTLTLLLAIVFIIYGAAILRTDTYAPYRRMIFDLVSELCGEKDTFVSPSVLDECRKSYMKPLETWYGLQNYTRELHADDQSYPFFHFGFILPYRGAAVFLVLGAFMTLALFLSRYKWLRVPLKLLQLFVTCVYVVFVVIAAFLAALYVIYFDNGDFKVQKFREAFQGHSCVPSPNLSSHVYFVTIPQARYRGLWGSNPTLMRPILKDMCSPEKNFSFPREFFLKELFYVVLEDLARGSQEDRLRRVQKGGAHKNSNGDVGPKHEHSVSSSPGEAREKTLRPEDLDKLPKNPSALDQALLDAGTSLAVSMPVAFTIFSKTLNQPDPGIANVCEVQKLFRCSGFHTGDCPKGTPAGPCHPNARRAEGVDRKNMRCVCYDCPSSVDIPERGCLSAIEERAKHYRLDEHVWFVGSKRMKAEVYLVTAAVGLSTLAMFCY